MRQKKASGCELCGSTSTIVSQAVGICRDCLLNKFDLARPSVLAKHAQAREEFELPSRIPRSAGGITCKLCSNECQIAENQYGFCGLRTIRNKRVNHLAGTPPAGLLHWYRDQLPTNCVAEWVCEGSHHRGCHNLAIFYASCTADCLFCQNWHYRESKPHADNLTSARELAAHANSRTFCVCFFGGDPCSQMPHALAAAKILAERGVRICWETNGMQHPKFIKKAITYSFHTGGCVKFDLKAFEDQIHMALCGVSNQRTLDNFSMAGKYSKERPELPLVVASTLLIPGYIESDEISKIARFIAAVNPDIPYSLLVFAPNFFMSDLPITSAAMAREAVSAAQSAGLNNVHIGNRHLLGFEELG